MTNLLRQEKARFLVEELSLQLQTGEGLQAFSPDNTPLKISGSLCVSQQPDGTAADGPEHGQLQQSPAAALPCYKGLPTQGTVRKVIEEAVLNKVRPN